jgi:hypothetical protein
MIIKLMKEVDIIPFSISSLIIASPSLVAAVGEHMAILIGVYQCYYQ